MTRRVKYRAVDVTDEQVTQKGYRDRRTVRYSPRLVLGVADSASRRAVLAIEEATL
jgi:hypothetical protein